MFGGGMGSILASVFPEDADMFRVCIFLCMCGLFSAVIRTPMTAVLVVFELTGLAKKSVDPGVTFPLGNISGYTRNHVCPFFLVFTTPEIVTKLGDFGMFSYRRCVNRNRLIYL